MEKREVYESSERTVYTHCHLHHAAKLVLEQKTEPNVINSYDCMSSIILSAFCIEAFLNHMGSILLPYWDDAIKRDLNINNKLKILCHYLEIDADFKARPFQSFIQIVKYRNFMAHANTEKVTYKGIQKIYDGQQVKYAQTKWEKYSTPRIAKQWLEDVESIINIITDATGRNDIPPLWMLSTGIGGGTLK